MTIQANKVVMIHYTLTDDKGEAIDSSEGMEPLAYIHGTGTLVPGLEKELDGKKKGDSFKVTVSPEEGYGQYEEELVQTAPLSVFGEIQELQPGMQFEAEGPPGQFRLITVKEINGEEVVVDANHPLAGETLNFDISVEGVREATQEELEHGHVH